MNPPPIPFDRLTLSPESFADQLDRRQRKEPCGRHGAPEKSGRPPQKPKPIRPRPYRLKPLANPKEQRA